MEQQLNEHSPSTPGVERGQRGSDHDQIMALVEGVHEAFRRRDIEKVMSYYSPQIVAYDIMPPLAYNGAGEYKRSWQMAMDAMGEIGPLEMEEERLLVSGELGVLHCLCRMSGTLKKDNQKIEAWTRYTGVFEKFGDQWLISHEQLSVPIDMETEQACWELKPGDPGMVH